MIAHIVAWKLKDCDESGKKEEVGRKIKRMLENLKNSIPEIIKIECGLNINKSDSAYDISLYSLFDSIEKLKIYQNHPQHRQVAEFISRVVARRVVVDYQI